MNAKIFRYFGLILFTLSVLGLLATAYFLFITYLVIARDIGESPYSQLFIALIFILLPEILIFGIFPAWIYYRLGQEGRMVTDRRLQYALIFQAIGAAVLTPALYIYFFCCVHFCSFSKGLLVSHLMLPAVTVYGVGFFLLLLGKFPRRPLPPSSRLPKRSRRKTRR